MIPERIFGVDPGGTTGSCLYSQGTWDTQQQTPAVFVSRFFDYLRDVTDAAQNYYATPVQMVVVVERFTPSTRHLSVQPDAVELIGYLRHTCAQFDIPFIMQSPAAAKGRANNPLLKHIGAYAKKTPHGNDAARHTALYISNKYPQEWRKMLEGYVPPQ